MVARRIIVPRVPVNSLIPGYAAFVWRELVHNIVIHIPRRRMRVATSAGREFLIRNFECRANEVSNKIAVWIKSTSNYSKVKFTFETRGALRPP